MAAPHPIDIEMMRRFFSYDPDTGVITWRETRGKGMSGCAAGTKNYEGYIRIHCMGRSYKAHRIAWALFHNEQPPVYIDHINGQRDDNRINNLRACKNQENCQNSRMPKHNSTGYKGVAVCGNPETGRFRAYISPHRKQIHIGVFDTPEEAAIAYNKEAVRWFGEFARINDIPGMAVT